MRLLISWICHVGRFYEPRKKLVSFYAFFLKFINLGRTWHLKVFVCLTAADRMLSIGVPKKKISNKTCSIGYRLCELLPPQKCHQLDHSTFLLQPTQKPTFPPKIHSCIRSFFNENVMRTFLSLVIIPAII